MTPSHRFSSALMAAFTFSSCENASSKLDTTIEKAPVHEKNASAPIEPPNPNALGKQHGFGLSAAVVLIYAADEKTALGTGFIVGQPLTTDKTRFFPVLVTAKHVLAGQPAIHVRFNTKQTPVGQTYDLTTARATGDLWEHLDANVDVAALRIPLPPPSAELRIVPLDLVATRQRYIDEEIKETDRVVFPGLLVGLTGMDREYPVVREGSIALIPETPITLDGKRTELILLNAAANQGSSGAPVFLWPGPRLRSDTGFTVGGTQPVLLCIIDGFFNSVPRPVFAMDPSSGATVPAVFNGPTANQMVLTFREDSNLGYCAPAWKLHEILEQPATVKRLLELEAQ